MWQPATISLFRRRAVFPANEARRDRVHSPRKVPVIHRHAVVDIAIVILQELHFHLVLRGFDLDFVRLNIKQERDDLSTRHSRPPLHLGFECFPPLLTVHNSAMATSSSDHENSIAKTREILRALSSFLLWGQDLYIKKLWYPILTRVLDFAGCLRLDLRIEGVTRGYKQES